MSEVLLKLSLVSFLEALLQTSVPQQPPCAEPLQL